MLSKNINTFFKMCKIIIMMMKKNLYSVTKLNVIVCGPWRPQ